jgi:hypothetical protein
LDLAISELFNKFEIAVPVHYARVIGDGDSAGHCKVKMLRPDFSEGEIRDVILGRNRVYPGVVVRVAEDRVTYGPGKLAIVGADFTVYQAGGTNPPAMLELHGSDHGHGQVDEISNLHQWQFYPLRVQPYSGLTVEILSGIYIADASYRELAAPTTLDMTPYLPAAGNWIFNTLSIDGSGSINVTQGTPAGSVGVTDIPFAPDGEWTLSAIRMASWYTGITRYDIIPLQHLHAIAEVFISSIINEALSAVVAEIEMRLSTHIQGG